MAERLRQRRRQAMQSRSTATAQKDSTDSEDDQNQPGTSAATAKKHKRNQQFMFVENREPPEASQPGISSSRYEDWETIEIDIIFYNLNHYETHQERLITMGTRYGGTVETDLSYELGPCVTISYNLQDITKVQVSECIGNLQWEEANFPTEFRIRINDPSQPKRKRRRTQEDPDTTDSESDSDSDSDPDDRDGEDEPDPLREDWSEQGNRDNRSATDIQQKLARTSISTNLKAKQAASEWLKGKQLHTAKQSQPQSPL